MKGLKVIRYIDKELLSEVLGIEVFKVKDKTTGDLYVPDNCIGFEWKEEIAGLINIYELAHKCKEWALNFNENVFWLDTRLHNDCTTIWLYKNGLQVNVVFQEKTEPEAIFKACDWIYNNEGLN